MALWEFQMEKVTVPNVLVHNAKAALNQCLTARLMIPTLVDTLVLRTDSGKKESTPEFTETMTSFKK
jgi:hypothetical protein